MDTTIIDQMNKFLINIFVCEFDFKKPGTTRIKTINKKKAGTICSKAILTIPETFSFLKEFFNTWVGFFVFNFSKSF